jgi:hypothetical protein
VTTSAPRETAGDAAPWLTVADVAAYLGVPIDDADRWAGICATSAMSWVEARRPDIDYRYPPEFVIGGATILAGRWYVRRGSPNGIAGTYDSGAYLPRTDRDIEMMLGLRQPRVA